jgi:hypothetical protein
VRREAWLDGLYAAGAAPAAYVPPGGPGRTDLEEVAGAAAVEDATLATYAVTSDAATPAVVTFLDGVQHWQVIGYDGVVPIVRAHVAAAARRRGADRRLRTAAETHAELLVTAVAALRPAVRRALERSDLRLVDLAAEEAEQPGRALEAARGAVERARVEAERALGERVAARLGPDEWLVVDGVLSESAVLAAHPRALGVIKSHGAQYFNGAELERALTLAAGRRTSVFRPRGRARHEVYSWYLRLWPWEGNDLLYGLLRLEARPHADTVAGATATSGWIARERAPLSLPDTRWDRLLYPIWDVEQYLKARAPRPLRPAFGSPLPRAAS